MLENYMENGEYSLCGIYDRVNDGIWVSYENYLGKMEMW